MKMQKIRLVLVVDYEIPADLTARKIAYGTIDPTECFTIDMEVDAAATYQDLDVLEMRLAE